MRLRSACIYGCKTKGGYINNDGQICCLSCNKIQGDAARPEDEILDKLEEIAGLLFHLTEIMTPFVRQNIDPADLSEDERDMLFGDDDSEVPTDSSKSN
jgi:hypothetical protein